MKKKFLYAKAILLLAFLFNPGQALARSWGGDCVKDGVATVQGIGCLLLNLLEIILPLLGLAAGIMFLVAGFQLIIAGGEAEAMQKAKNTATYAIFGLVLAFLSWFILRFIEYFTGVNVTQFNIGI